MSDTYSNTITVDPDERAVEEVHCIECGAPIPAIPSWYANVNVKFTCDTCRQKAPRLGQPAGAGLGEPENARETSPAGDVDPDLAADDLEIEDDADLSGDEAADIDEE